ncbi:RpiR family transcriptional regulator [Bosea sp. AK1]|nr:RpiR family transcriptional regulator [Bosea sp. AK1]
MQQPLQNRIDAFRSAEEWLHALKNNPQISKSCERVIQCIIEGVEQASYATAAEVAACAGVNTATVSRAAQFLGFDGWTELRSEIRNRYLSTLSPVQLRDAHRSKASGEPLEDAISLYMEHLASLRRTFDRSLVKKTAQALAGAKRRVIIASGSSAVAGRLLGHHAGLAGYRCEILEDPVSISNNISDLCSDDVVVIFTVWRLYRWALFATEFCRERGVPVYLITDSVNTPVADKADHALVVPSEGFSFFPTVLPSICLVEAISAALFDVDADNSRNYLESAEKKWDELGILYYSSTPSKT